MARIRSIKHEFFYSEQVTSVSMTARLFFIGLWTVADRDGRLQWSPRKLKAQIFPYDDVQIHALAEELTAASLLHVYEIAGTAYGWIPGFAKHQRPHPKEPESTVPACPADHDPREIPWKRTVEPCKETAGNFLPGSIPSSPTSYGLMGSGSMESGSMGSGEGERKSPPARPPALLMSPMQFERLKERHAFVGSRLRIPNGLHADFRKDLGGSDPDSRLQAWYLTLNDGLEESGEPIPELFSWIRPRFAEFAQGAATEAVKAAFMKAVGGSRGQ